MSLVTEATDTAKALVTAAMVDDHEATRLLFPEDREESIYLIIALSKLSARLVRSLANERGDDPLAMWQQAMTDTAAQGCH